MMVEIDPKLRDLISTPEGRRHLAYHMALPLRIDPEYADDGVHLYRYNGKLYTREEWAEFTQKLSSPGPCPICNTPEKP